MPVLDTQVLFALNPRDRFHQRAFKRLAELREKKLKLYATDTAVLEFQVVLRSVDRKPEAVRKALLALRSALQINGVIEAATLDTELLARQCEIEQEYGLSYFDSLIAASALRLYEGILSDDESFGKVPTIIRTPLS